jgi:hypothetical protein
MNTNKTKDLALHKYIYDRKRRYDFIMLNSQVEDDKGKNDNFEIPICHVCKVLGLYQ